MSALREKLLKAGFVYAASVGGISAGADVSLVAGGGAGTVIDSDQPEIIIGVPTGYYFIPLEFQWSGQVDLDADAEVANVLLFMDSTQSAPSAPTATALGKTKCWPTGGASVATAWHTVTADITDPVCSQVLVYETIRAMDAGTAASQQLARFNARYQPDSPQIFTGPCSLVCCWGGTAAVNGMARVVWAEVPTTYQL